MVSLERSLANLSDKLSSEPRSWVNKLKRIGSFTQGLLYLAIGTLALFSAFGVRGGSQIDARGALLQAYRQPFGKILVVGISLGLIAFAVWRFIQAIQDTERKGRDLKGIAIRIGFASAGIIYSALAYSGIRLALFAERPARNGEQVQTAEALSLPYGWALVLIAGGIIFGIGIFQFFRVYKRNFLEDFSHLNGTAKKVITWAGNVGLTSRGIVFCIIGAFLTIAAYRSDSSEAKGISHILADAAAHSYGQIFLTILALGLISFGIFCAAKARYS